MSGPNGKSSQQLAQENEELRARLTEAEETLRAIREGEVDAVVVSGSKGERIFSLTGSESIYRHIAETMNEAAFTISLEGNILFCNRQFSTLLKTPQEQIVGRRLHDFVSDKQRHEVVMLLTKSQSATVRQRLIFQVPDGLSTPAQVSAALLHGPDGPCICVVATDLTELENSTEIIERLRKNQEALRESEERFRSVLDNSLDCIYRLNLKTKRFEYISPAAQLITGFSPTELLAQDADAARGMIHPEDLPVIQAALARLEETGEARTDYRQKTKSGEYRWISNHMSLSRDGAGRPLFRGGTIRDITERKQAERERARLLVEVQNRVAELDATISSMATGLLIYDSTGKAIQMNDAARDTLPEKPFLESGIRERSRLIQWEKENGQPFSLEEIPAMRALRGDTSRNVVMTTSLADRKLWISASAAPIRTPDGKMLGAVASFVDITENKRIANAVQERERLLQDVIDGSPSPIFLKDRDGKFITINASLEKSLGMSRAELKGKTDYDIASKEMADYWRAHDKQVIETGKAIVIEELADLRDGHHVYLANKFPLVGVDGKVYGVGAISHDITDRKRAEDVLRDSKERLALAASATRIGMFEWNISKDKVLWTQTHEAIFGYAPATTTTTTTTTTIEHDYRKWADRVHPDDMPIVEKETRRCMQERKPFELQYRIIWPDGSLHWVETKGIFLHDADGKASRMIGVVMDITERKRMEDELRQAHEDLERRVAQRTQELQAANVKLKEQFEQLTQAQTEKERLSAQYLQSQKLEAVGLLAGGIAHDFNNIVSSIVGNNYFLLEGLPPKDPLREHCLEIGHSSDMAVSLTRQLLSITRKQNVKVRVLDVNSVIMGLSKMLRRLLGVDVRLNLRLQSAIWPVKMDAGHLEQIVINLSVNARDAMPQGGKLSLLTKNLEVKKSRRVASGAQLPPGTYVMLEFRDNGIGMDEATQARIFEPFFTTKEHGKGTGLGLATVQTIVKEYRGCIGVTSAPQKGCTFQIHIPSALGGAEAMLPGELSQEMAGGHETILIVEDNDGLRNIINKTLLEKGYHVISVGTAEEAAAQCRDSLLPVDLLLTDLILPGMNGADFAASLKKERPQLRVVFMTGYPGMTLGSGAWQKDTPLLEKPFSPKILLSTLRQVLSET
jgi:PAS domain S-box-containing protein